MERWGPHADKRQPFCFHAADKRYVEILRFARDDDEPKRVIPSAAVDPGRRMASVGREREFVHLNDEGIGGIVHLDDDGNGEADAAQR